jgi:hypothetical protein
VTVRERLHCHLFVGNVAAFELIAHDDQLRLFDCQYHGTGKPSVGISSSGGQQ